MHQVELEAQNEELPRAQAETEAALEKYIDLFDFAPIGYFVLDAQGLIHEANLAGAALLGLERSRFVKKRFGQFVAPDDRARFNDFCSRVLQTGEKLSCQVMLGNNGQVVYALIEGLAVADGRATRRQFRAALTDISERKRAEEELRESRDALEERVAERTAALARTIDELRVAAIRAAAAALHGFETL